MKAITLCQPFATLVSKPDGWTHRAYRCAKRVENRTWHTAYRGTLAIHAGKSHSWLGRFNVDDDRELPGMPFGAVVAVCTLVGCVEANEIGYGGRENPASIVARWPWFADHPHVSGPWCWVLENVRALPTSVPCAGAMSLWDLPPDVLAAVEAQLKAGGP